mmetsp:Transcript_12319/g.29042  ORF Transcript_12319/g.29042 Transcript_12319/m.29042 type:complete len:234 (+) Transcript_12319:1388-2089(+)
MSVREMARSAGPIAPPPALATDVWCSQSAASTLASALSTLLALPEARAGRSSSLSNSSQSSTSAVTRRRPSSAGAASARALIMPLPPKATAGVGSAGPPYSRAGPLTNESSSETPPGSRGMPYRTDAAQALSVQASVSPSGGTFASRYDGAAAFALGVGCPASALLLAPPPAPVDAPPPPPFFFWAFSAFFASFLSSFFDSFFSPPPSSAILSVQIYGSMERARLDRLVGACP